jgi:hypothetical protein
MIRNHEPPLAKNWSRFGNTGRQPLYGFLYYAVAEDSNVTKCARAGVFWRERAPE